MIVFLYKHDMSGDQKIMKWSGSSVYQLQQLRKSFIYFKIVIL